MINLDLPSPRPFLASPPSIRPFSSPSAPPQPQKGYSYLLKAQQCSDVVRAFVISFSRAGGWGWRWRWGWGDGVGGGEMGDGR